MSGSPHTDATRRRSLQLYQRNDLTLADVAEMAGASVETVRRWASAAGLSRRNGGACSIPTRTVGAAMELYAGGMSPRRIAERLGISRDSVERHAKKTGTERKAPIDRKRLPASVRRRAVELYSGGRPATWVSEVLGISWSAVLSAARAAGVKIRPSRSDLKLDDARVRAAYERLRSTRRTAAELGVSRSGVVASLRRSGCGG